MDTSGYWYTARPVDVAHGHPFLIFDGESRLDVPFTAIAKVATAQFSQGTVRTYLAAVLPFLTFLTTDPWQVRAGRRWDDPPASVRQVIADYLVGRLSCKTLDRDRYHLVAPTAQTPGTVRVFLSALKFCYTAARRLGYYQHVNPLADGVGQILSAREYADGDNGPPPMPPRSGVEARRSPRLTDNYFVLRHEDWVPQAIRDRHFPRRVLAGGRQVPGWGPREDCVVILLFETGARISEVCGLTLGDWLSHGGLTEARAFNKGSHGRRVKTIHFSKETARRLVAYVDGERGAHDPAGYRLDDYRRLAKRGVVDLDRVPLFLSAQRTPLSPKAFRDGYWRPACLKAGILARPHQARHWYVTQCIDAMHEQSADPSDFERRKRNFMAAMHWRSDEETMRAYLHLYTADDNARTAVALQHRLADALDERPARPRRSSPRPNDHPVEPSTSGTPTDPDADYLLLIRLGGVDGE